MEWNGRGLNMPFDRCTKCKTTHWTDKPCPPLFKVCWEEYDPDEWFKVRAETARDAAEKWAEQFDSNHDDVIIFNGEAENVIVRDSSGKTFRFAIAAEYSKEYDAYGKEETAEEKTALQTTSDN
jgi:hypothetical protein